MRFATVLIAAMIFARGWGWGFGWRQPHWNYNPMRWYDVMLPEIDEDGNAVEDTEPAIQEVITGSVYDMSDGGDTVLPEIED